ncbi:unnamed protein product [Rotaria sp. Silwood2]|nr:unnamed protein product [Rotaria sp. Silwood2]CAF3150582.1 unnamed protein product [Rotaria sp. Silwood2]CAF3394344.1 unnamed protein product [Rotaria sp. Silwood2]CAF4274634.1 unnamed protein product [Rotaria sp. Silwood2]CAF4337795.1 unnamed protein product [Rotaria sp. Silwood2]
MNSSKTSYYPSFSSLDLYYLSVSSNIFLYGYIIILIIGFTGNICQIITFSRKTLRNISTGVLFLALCISDTIYLLLSIYVVIVFGFNIPDRSNYARDCQFRHYLNYLSTNFSAWMLATISCDRWIRSQFTTKAQQFCTPRTAIYTIIIVFIFDCLLHIHLLTPMFGQIAPGVTTNCGPDSRYPSYTYFYNTIWPVISLLTVTIIPASCMVFCLIAITINVKTHRNRVIAIGQTNENQQDRRRAHFLHRQMLILMLATLMLFFLTTCPIALLNFAIATLNIQQSFSFKLMLISILDFITLLNYSLNFYLHSLTSKLFRREFFQYFPCSISITFRRSNQTSNVTRTQRHLIRQQQGTVTQLIG